MKPSADIDKQNKIKPSRLRRTRSLLYSLFTGRSCNDIAGGTSARRARVTSVRADVMTARAVIIQLDSLYVASAARRKGLSEENYEMRQKTRVRRGRRVKK